MHNDLWSWPISSRSFNHGFAIKLLKYGTSCNAHTVLHGFFLYLAQMIFGVRGCVPCNDLWPWSISSRSFGHDCNETAKIWHILSCPLYSVYNFEWILFLFGTNDHLQERVYHAVTFDLDIYREGYLAVTLPISWIIIICGTNTTHEGTRCHTSFLGQ